jgi:copper transport protein
MAHAAFAGSDPAPGGRVESSPARITLVFTEPLNRRLARATLRPAAGGAPVPAGLDTDGPRRLVLVPSRPLPRGAYRVEWHTVSTEDGHALEGVFGFGVRAPAAAARAIETGPLARGGWARILARIALYTSTLMLVAALLLPWLVRRPRGWPAPEAVAGELDARAVGERRRRVTGDLAWIAVTAAVAAALADAADAAGGLRPAGLADYLLANAAGAARVLVVVLLAGAALLRDRVPRAAAAFAVLALGAIAASGHAASADPRVPSVLNDWLHLVSAALWLGGIALLALLWWRPLRGAERAARLALARHVLAPFGPVAIGAFAVAATTGLVSLVTQLGRLDALWDTAYGRLLAVKVALVGAIAAASALHALRWRPRLLAANPHPPERLERRHWRLWRSEPWLALAVVAAVAGLVAFPLPPRQLTEAGGAIAAVCDPCPLPRAAADELPVADQAGSHIVAAWVRRAPAEVSGTVHVLDIHGRPAAVPIDLPGAKASRCGPGCRRFALPGGADAVEVGVRERGRRYLARLPAHWESSANRRAARLLRRAEDTMRALPGVRELERITSGPGTLATTEYRLRAPDRLAWRTGGGVLGVVVGRRQWVRAPGIPWREDAYGAGLAFRTRTWFRWRTYARAVRLLGERTEHGRRVADLALMDETTPVWFRLTVELSTHRVLRERMVAQTRFGNTRFVDFGRRFAILPP